MKKGCFFMLLIVFMSLGSCTITKKVNSISDVMPAGANICIEKNEKVAEPDILNVIQNVFVKSGYQVNVFPKAPESCDYRLTYIAYRSWDIFTFLSHANIYLFNKHELIGSVEYKLPAEVFLGGGINPEKWNSTEQKIAPLLEKMLNIKKQ